MHLALIVSFLALLEVQSNGPSPVPTDTVAAPPATTDTIASTYVENSDDGLLDTLTVYAGNQIIRRIPVNKYVMAYQGIALPMRRVYHVGFWSARLISGSRSSPDINYEGLWKNQATIRVKGPTRLIVTRRDGTTREVIPQKP